MISAKAALLQVLERGPGYGRELAERVSDMTEGQVSLYDGSTYRALQQLLSQGQIEECDTDGKRKKRYCITSRGIRQAKLDREVVNKLFGHDQKSS